MKDEFDVGYFNHNFKIDSLKLKICLFQDEKLEHCMSSLLVIVSFYPSPEPLKGLI